MAARGTWFQRCPKPRPGVTACPTRCRVHRWAYRVELRRVASERRQLTKSGFESRSAAQQALTQLLAAVDTGQYEPSRQKTAEYLEEWFQRQIDNTKIRPTTARSYRGHLDHYLIPHLGHVRLTELRPHHIDRMFAAIRKANVDAERPVGPTTMRRIHATLRSALGSAVKRRVLPYNPASSADIPPNERTAIRVWTPEQYGKFLDCIEGDRLFALYVLAGQRGLRRGELLGLRWEDIDFERAELRVVQQLVQVGHEIRFGPPKTERARRVVALDSASVEALRAWRVKQAAERLAWGPAYEDTGLVFTREDGAPVHPERVTKAFRRLASRAGLPLIRLHDLRHTSATLGLLAGEDMRLVSRRLGHSSITVTVDVYTHVAEDAAREAAERLAALVRRERGSA